MQKEARLDFIKRMLADERTVKKEAREAVKELIKSRLLVNMRSFTHVLSSLGKRKWFGMAREISDHMLAKGFKPNEVTYGTMINGCSRWEKAVELLDEMAERGMEVSAIHMNSAINACVKAKQWQAALAVFADLDKWEIWPTEVTYGCLMGACTRRWEQALMLKDDMLDREVRGNRYVWNSVLQAILVGKQAHLAKPLLMEMKVQAGFQPDRGIYEGLLKACEQQGHWKMALQLLGKMKEDGFDPVLETYSRMVSTLAKGGEDNRALDLFSRLRERGFTPGELGYQGAMMSQQRRGKAEKVLEIFEEARDKEVKSTPVMYNAVLQASEQLEEWDSVMEIFDSLESRGFQADAGGYDAAIAACAALGRTERAAELMQQMLKRGLSPAGRSRVAMLELSDKSAATTSALATAAEACARDGELFQALRLLEKAKPTAEEVPAYEAVISACSRGRRVADADKLVTSLRERGLSIGPQAHASLVRGFSKASAWESVLRCVDFAQGEDGRDALRREELQRVLSCAVRACSFDPANRWSEALSWLQLMKTTLVVGEYVPNFSAADGLHVEEDEELKSDSDQGKPEYEFVIQALSDHAGWQKAALLLREMESFYLAPSDEARAASFPVSSQSARLTETLISLDEMYKNNLQPDENAYRMAIDAALKLGRRDKATELRQELRNVAMFERMGFSEAEKQEFQEMRRNSIKPWHKGQGWQGLQDDMKEDVGDKEEVQSVLGKAGPRGVWDMKDKYVHGINRKSYEEEDDLEDDDNEDWDEDDEDWDDEEDDDREEELPPPERGLGAWQGVWGSRQGEGGDEPGSSKPWRREDRGKEREPNVEYF